MSLIKKIKRFNGTTWEEFNIAEAGSNLQNGEGLDSLIQIYSGEVDDTHFSNTALGESAAVFGEANTVGANRALSAGKLNVIEGLKLAIASKAGISDVLTEEKRIIVTSNGDNRYEVFVAGEDNLNATLYNMSGVPVLNTTSQDETIMVDASNLVKGVYVLSIQGETAKYTKRILVK